MGTQRKLQWLTCKRRESSVVRPRANQQIQVSRGQMLFPQSRLSRHNIPENVRSFTTQLHQIDATRSVLERREAMDPNIRSREHDELRGDSVLRLRLSWRQRNEEIVKRGSCARGARDNHRQKQCRSRAVCSSIGCSKLISKYRCFSLNTQSVTKEKRKSTTETQARITQDPRGDGRSPLREPKEHSHQHHLPL